MGGQGPERVLPVSAPDHTRAYRYREDRPGPHGTTEPSSRPGHPPILASMQLTSGRRRALSTVLAVVLAIESVSAVAAAAQVSTSRSGAPAHLDPSSAAVVADAPSTPRPSTARRADPAAGNLPAPPPDATSNDARASDGDAKPASHRHRDARSNKHHGKAGRADARSRAAAATSYEGRNRVWIPSLGIRRSVAWFPCGRSREPDNAVYRWGCAGANNVYLLGHAWGVFEPLHDAYVRGQLRRGMKAWYADANGRVRTYAVRWWKLVRPTTAASWAWASLATPSMTLQTCIGARSQYRLMVRLVRVDG
jgi:hypothetical protein